MTPRMMYGLLVVLQKVDLVEFHTTLLAYSTVHGQKIPTLNEFLNLTLNQGDSTTPVFDEKTDKFLEAKALERLRNKGHGK